MTTSIRKKTGWALKLDGKYWGETYPADSGHGGGMALYGFTDDLEKVRIDTRDEMPPSKVCFFNERFTHYVEQVKDAEWVRVTIEIETRIVEPDAELNKMKLARDLLKDLMDNSPMTGAGRVSDLDENLTGMSELFTFLDRLGKPRDILVMNAFIRLEQVIKSIEGNKQNGTQ